MAAQSFLDPNNTRLKVMLSLRRATMSATLCARTPWPSCRNQRSLACALANAPCSLCTFFKQAEWPEVERWAR